MAGTRRGTKKMRLLSEIIEKLDQVPSKKLLEQQQGAELPSDVLQMIISRLSLRDNIRASAVCKSWLTASIAVRNPDKSPLLMIFPKFGDSYEFYDPLRRKSFWLDLPELLGSRICCGRDGWLLLCKPNTRLVFFFSPYNRELINLPEFDLTIHAVAFSVAPTSANCVVFAIKNLSPTNVSLSTWRQGEIKWFTRSYQLPVPFLCDIRSNIVFFNGVLCFLSNNSVLGVYNPEAVTFLITYNLHLSGIQDNFFLTEHNGDIFVIGTYSNENPIIIKVDLTEERTHLMETLGGTTFFVNSLSFLARTDLPGTMRNKVYFSKVLYHGKHCVSYCVDKGRYYPRDERYNWREQSLTPSIWIEPPENLSDYL